VLQHSPSSMEIASTSTCIKIDLFPKRMWPLQSTGLFKHCWGKSTPRTRSPTYSSKLPSSHRTTKKNYNGLQSHQSPLSSTEVSYAIWCLEALKSYLKDISGNSCVMEYAGAQLYDTPSGVRNSFRMLTLPFLYGDRFSTNIHIHRLGLEKGAFTAVSQLHTAWTHSYQNDQFCHVVGTSRAWMTILAPYMFYVSGGSTYWGLQVLFFNLVSLYNSPCLEDPSLGLFWLVYTVL
jgi:hypothetical protein